MPRIIVKIGLAAAFLTSTPLATFAEPLGSAFTYQGRLKVNGSLVNDSADFRFTLWDAESGGSQIGGVNAVDNDLNVTVTNGLFAATLNEVGQFGPTALDGNQRWLQIEVRRPAGSTNPYVSVTPRQPLGATPYALNTPGVRVHDGMLDLFNLGPPPGEIRLFPAGPPGVVPQGAHFTAGGYIGFGTTAPSSVLELSRVEPDVALTITNPTAGGHSWRLQSSGGGSSEAPGSFSLRDVTTGATRLAVDASGNVGIGVQGSVARLWVVSGTEGSDTIGLRLGTPGSLPGTAVSMEFVIDEGGFPYEAGRLRGFAPNGSVPGRLELSSAAGPVMNLSANGNVGIGTSSPIYPLHVAGGKLLLDTDGFFGKVRAPSDDRDAFWFGSGTNISFGQFELRNSAGTVTNVLITDNGALSLRNSFTNNTPRPPVSPLPASGEVRALGMNGLGVDDGFLRLSAGGSSSPTQQSFIDLSGYSAVPDMFNNIVLGTSGMERVRIDENGNVGIGTTSPEATLHVASNVGSEQGIRLSHYDAGENPLGGASAQAIVFRSDGASPGSGTFAELAFAGSHDQNAFAISAFKATDFSGSFATLSLNPAGGNVGIGVSNPSFRLEIPGAQASETVNVVKGGPFWVIDSGAGYANTHIGYSNYLFGGGSGPGGIGYNVNWQWNGGSPQYYKPAPDKSLWLTFDAGNEMRLVADSGTTIGPMRPTEMGPTELMRVTNAGNVGIGTAEPLDRLHVFGPGGLRVQSSDAVSGSITLTGSGPNAQVWTVGRGNDGDGDFGIGNGSFELVTVDADGNVGIGTTSPAHRLHVKGDGGGTPLLSLENNGPSQYASINFTSSGIPTLWAMGKLPSDVFFLSSNENGAVMNMTPSGLVGISRTPLTHVLEVEGTASKTAPGDWLANSDRRIKTDVEPIADGLGTLNRIRVCSFRYTDEYRGSHPSIADRPYMNVIAQEFAEVFPEYVRRSGEKLSDGGEILQVDPYPLTIYSVAAIQELHGLVEQKEAEIAAQQARIDDLSARLQALERKMDEMAGGSGSSGR